MYKLLLVDDEANMRTRMIETVRWQEYGFEIVCDAENGLDALEKIEIHNPDVVITDIKMPFMDGIELSKRVYEKYPLTKIIILTGFDDFKYAKAAINLKVIDYILKPITHDSLVDVLKKTKDLLDSEYEEKRDMNRLKEYYANSFPIMRNKVLQQLVAGRIPKEQIKERLDYYKVEVPQGPYRVAVVGIKHNEGDFTVSELEANKLMLSDAVDSIVNQREIGLPFVYEDFIVVIFRLSQSEDKGTPVDSVLLEIQQYIEKYMAWQIMIAIGHKFDRMEDIHRSYKQALSALDYASDTRGSEILTIWDVEPKSKIQYLDLCEEETEKAIKSCSLMKMQSLIDAIFTDIVDHNILPKDYSFHLLEYVLHILKVAIMQGVSLDERYTQDEVIEFLKNTNDLKELKTWINQLGSFVIAEILTIRNDTTMNYVRKAIHYIEESYANPDISVEALCAILAISPNYFSAMFKKSTDMTFTKYLTQIRLEEAKKLLKASDKKSFEIAELVGFSDANYFSYCFKKNVGLSPSQYRKS